RVGVGADTAWGSGGDFGALVGVDAQLVVPMPALLHRGGDQSEENPPTDVIAISGFVRDTVGELPFYSLPTLGGSDTLRGYIGNRSRARDAAPCAVEYSIGIVPRGGVFTETLRIERIGIGVFYEGGTVASGAEDLHQGRYLDSYGMGLRVAFSREATFRIDIG